VNLGKFGSFPAKELIGKPFNAGYEIYGGNHIRQLQFELPSMWYSLLIFE
jgi:hypothetical protein